ncbi:MAG: hypothetical protein Q8936_19530 [Bacillota bacterium]|nr:hypothetical protein [Bacillota bacterium]
MKLQYDKQIESNKLTSIVMFKEYGTQSLTADQEKSYIKDYSPKIEYKDLVFKRYFKVVNGDVVEDKGIVNYTNALSITLPTSVIASPVNAGSANITIGTKVISLTIADTINGVATATEIENAVLNAVKTDASVLALYSASDISVVSGKVVGTKVVTTDPTSLVQAINSMFGTGSVVTTSAVSNVGSVLVSIALNNKELYIDETFSTSFSVEVKSIEPSEINAVLTTPELVCQAKCELFRVVIRDAVKAKLEELRNKINGFEGEVEETL